jgi:hypothetical protein
MRVANCGRLSPDINPCDFFLWGFLKEKVFQRRPENVAQLGAHIMKLCRALSEGLCRTVVTNASVMYVNLEIENFNFDMCKWKLCLKVHVGKVTVRPVVISWLRNDEL